MGAYGRDRAGGNPGRPAFIFQEDQTSPNADDPVYFLLPYSMGMLDGGPE